MPNIARRHIQAFIAVKANEQFSIPKMPKAAIKGPPCVLILFSINYDMLNVVGRRTPLSLLQAMRICPKKRIKS